MKDDRRFLGIFMNNEISRESDKDDLLDFIEHLLKQNKNKDDEYLDLIDTIGKI